MADAGREEAAAVRRAAASTTLRCVRPLPPVATASPPIMLAVVCNELEVLPDFLRHHRAGGVERFAIVDDGSTDGSRELLGDQPDVEIYAADERYAGVTSLAWFHRLVQDLGPDRWYVQADADEQLVFDRWEQGGVEGLVRDAERAGVRRVRGALVDRYAVTPVFAPGPLGDRTLSTAFPLFDAGSSYAEVDATVGVCRRGGPRRRMAPDSPLDPELTKLPVFRLGPDETVANSHAIHPYDGNFGPCVIGINHYKFTAGFAGKIERALRDRAYWNESAEYEWYAQALRDRPDLSLVNPTSREYRGPGDLVAAGVIDPYPW